MRKTLHDLHTEVVVAVDFNGTIHSGEGAMSAAHRARKRVRRSSTFMAELSLQSRLPAGVMTFVSDGGRMSTIDLMLTTAGLASELAKCSVWEHEYRSDHQAICTSFSIDVERQDNADRLLFKNMRWDKIREAVEQQKKEEGFPSDDVDEMASRLTRWRSTHWRHIVCEPNHHST